MKFYFLRIKSDEVGTTLKHPETINGNVKNLSKRIEMKDKGNANFYFKNLTLPLGRVRLDLSHALAHTLAHSTLKEHK